MDRLVLYWMKILQFLLLFVVVHFIIFYPLFTVMNKGQCVTKYYRWIQKNGGYIWIQSSATIAINAKNANEKNIIWVNYVLRYTSLLLWWNCHLKILFLPVWKYLRELVCKMVKAKHTDLLKLRCDFLLLLGLYSGLEIIRSTVVWAAVNQSECLEHSREESEGCFTRLRMILSWQSERLVSSKRVFFVVSFLMGSNPEYKDTPMDIAQLPNLPEKASESSETSDSESDSKENSGRVSFLCAFYCNML